MRSNVFLRDMNINVAAQDSRRIEVLAQNLPCFSGAQLAVDITLRSALTSNGEAHPQAADVDGAVLIQADTTRSQHTPRLQRQADANWSCLPSRQEGDGARKLSKLSGCSRSPKLGRSPQICSFSSP